MAPANPWAEIPTTKQKVKGDNVLQLQRMKRGLQYFVWVQGNKVRVKKIHGQIFILPLLYLALQHADSRG